MDMGLVRRQFLRMGADMRVATMYDRRWVWRPAGRSGYEGPPFELDVVASRRAKVFEIRISPSASKEVVFDVLDLQPADRHLLLAGRWKPEGRRTSRIERFLCGHDERAWFAAAVPGTPSTVGAAKEALKPGVVRASQVVHGVRRKNLNRRRNAGHVRQGEWFFVPAPELVVDERMVLHREPLQRAGGGKPHIAEFLYRVGGTPVMVCPAHPQGVTVAEYRDLAIRKPEARAYPWRPMARDPMAYVRGRVVHPDHKTVRLVPWHRVVPNTESETRLGSGLAFLD